MKLTDSEIDEIERMQLTSEEITLLRLRIRHSASAVAIMLGMTRQWASHILQRAEHKIRVQKGELR